MVDWQEFFDSREPEEYDSLGPVSDEYWREAKEAYDLRAQILRHPQYQFGSQTQGNLTQMSRGERGHYLDELRQRANDLGIATES